MSAALKLIVFTPHFSDNWLFSVCVLTPVRTVCTRVVFERLRANVNVKPYDKVFKHNVTLGVSQ